MTENFVRPGTPPGVRPAAPVPQCTRPGATQAETLGQHGHRWGGLGRPSWTLTERPESRRKV
jgi:hypothetical protein